MEDFKSQVAEFRKEFLLDDTSEENGYVYQLIAENAGINEEGVFFDKPLNVFDCILFHDENFIVTGIDEKKVFVKPIEDISKGSLLKYKVNPLFDLSEAIPYFTLNPQRNKAFDSDYADFFSLDKAFDFIDKTVITDFDGCFGEVILNGRVVLDLYGFRKFSLFDVLTDPYEYALLEEFEKHYGKLKFAWYNK